jgi:hypothetical protein
MPWGARLPLRSASGCHHTGEKYEQEQRSRRQAGTGEQKPAVVLTSTTAQLRPAKDPRSTIYRHSKTFSLRLLSNSCNQQQA